MKISIITVTLNSSATIAECIKSINNQTYNNIDHIIIDGNSEDRTIEIINSLSNRVCKIISEPDDGIYDAMNKGIKLADGDIVGILNSDDFYACSNTIHKVVDIFKNNGCDSLYGDLDFVSADSNKVIRKWKSSPFKPGSFSQGWHPPHPTFFVHKRIYERYGVFDTSFAVSADFELMLRFWKNIK
jgi:glycosyltransferase involved in cell wall biosynthesis